MCNFIKFVWLGCEKHRRNQPKIGQKTAVFRLLLIFAKTPYDSNKILYSPSTLYYGPLCAISFNSYGWDVRNIARINPKMAKKQPFFDFFFIFAKTVHTIRTKISTVVFYTIVWSMCAISINSYNWDWSESEGKRPKPTPLPHMRLWLQN